MSGAKAQRAAKRQVKRAKSKQARVTVKTEFPSQKEAGSALRIPKKRQAELERMLVKWVRSSLTAAREE